jgi:hypothetical protein
MAALRNLNTGTESVVGRSSLIGRSPNAHVRLSASGSSAEHASVRWLGAEWILRDLGSLNGTRVNNRPLGREWTLVRGDVIVFGDPSERWCWIDGSPPLLRAIADDGAVQEAGGTLLVLSDDRGPQASVYQIDGRWELDMNGQTRAVVDGESVQVGTRRFQLEIPDRQGTLDRTRGLLPERRIADATMQLRVSQDEEQVDVQLQLGDGKVHDLPSRAFHYALLLLARLRQQEEQAGAAPDEAGWIYSDELARRLAASPEKLNVDIHRIRQVLARLDLADDVENIIERRRTSGQLRLGIRDVTILARGLRPGECVAKSPSP